MLASCAWFYARGCKKVIWEENCKKQSRLIHLSAVAKVHILDPSGNTDQDTDNDVGSSFLKGEEMAGYGCWFGWEFRQVELRVVGNKPQDLAEGAEHTDDGARKRSASKEIQTWRGNKGGTSLSKEWADMWNGSDAAAGQD